MYIFTVDKINNEKLLMWKPSFEMGSETNTTVKEILFLFNAIDGERKLKAAFSAIVIV